MTEPRRVLLLGGTEEAVALNQVLSDRPDIDLVTSLAGRTRTPGVLKGEVLSGGFGGEEGLSRYLADHSINLVIDATHPFAARITATAFRSTKARGIAYARLSRPAWSEKPGDNWIRVANIAEALSALEGFSHIFLSIGRQELAAFEALRNKHFLVRSIEPATLTLVSSTVTYLQSRGPFTLAEEMDLLNKHGIEIVVSKNSGGSATYAKIEAARKLAIPVLMVERPAVPDCPLYETVDELLAALDISMEI